LGGRVVGVPRGRGEEEAGEGQDKAGGHCDAATGGARRVHGSQRRLVHCAEQFRGRAGREVVVEWVLRKRGGVVEDAGAVKWRRPLELLLMCCA
jgi:hypothetical protein